MNQSTVQNLQPIPTEYVGITFRSKSEAIFARALDLMGFWWEYEPEPFQTGDLWIPDFLVVSQQARRKIGLWLFEYKPSAPTNAYMGQMRNRAIELNPFMRGMWIYVIYGSAFNNDFGGFEWNAEESRFDHMQEASVEHFARHIIESSRYRFDLQSPE